MHNNVLLQGLNEAQREAVLHGEGPALVAAGPGSGKTTVITRRLLYLIQERKVPPQNILVITFTKEAAKSMQERFFKQLREFGMSRTTSTGFVSFGTFHSYFYQIIRSIRKYSEYQLITQQEKIKISRPILKEYSQDSVTEGEINDFLTQVSFYKNTGQLKSSLHKPQTDSDTKEQLQEAPHFFQMLEKYEACKENYKRLDFDDMLWLCRKALIEDKKVLQQWQKRYQYVLIDEFQDINPIQYELVRLLTVPPYNLFVVGDDDQAIYGFRGSDSKIFQRFLQEFQNAKQISLVTNYRCQQNIVKASKRLIEENKCRIAKELVSDDKNASKGQISAIGAVGVKDSYEQLAKWLKQKDITELDSQAVLFRTNSAMQMFASQLIRFQIPFVVRERFASVYDHFLAKDIMDYFQAAGGCRDRSLFLRIFQRLHAPLGREGLRTEQVDLEQVKLFYSSGFYESRQSVAAIEALERHFERLAKMRPVLGIHYILHAMDYQGYLLNKCRNRSLPEDWKQVLDWLMEDAGDFRDYAGWKEHQQIYEKELAQEHTTSKESKKGIHLLTLHAAKGLEFTKVYIMNLNEGTIPQIRRGEVLSQERLEEERRLFYVGMTRAKEELELHYVTGTKENPRVRSRFLEEVGEDFLTE